MNATEPEILNATSEQTSEISKYRLLAMSILFDAIGMLSFVIPGVGEFADVVWAPISAYLVFKLFKGTEGKIGGMVSLIEELVPGLDIIPTFTLTWIYKFIIKKGNA